MWRVGVFYATLGTGIAYSLSHAEHAYDIDGANRRWEAIAAAAPKPLPSAYTPLPPQNLRYNFNSDKIAACKATGVCRALQLDASTGAWAAEQLAAPRTLLHSAALAALALLGVPLLDAQAVLDAPRVHLLSPEQWAAVLGRDGAGGAVPRGRALDVGAASGHITESFAPLFQHVTAVEISDWLVWRLQRRGFTAFKTDKVSCEALRTAGLAAQYDAVFALNVLDRVPRSAAFLAALVDLTTPGGQLVIALPLPYQATPWLKEGQRKRQAAGASPREQWGREHGLAVAGTTWEEAASSVVQLLEESGLEVKRVVRAPYLSQGWWSMFASDVSLFALDAAIFVARKRHKAQGCGVEWRQAAGSSDASASRETQEL